MNNPFPFSLDNKRYQTWNYYLQTTFHQKVAKVPIDAFFTCPNRDGRKSVGGCRFCSAKGSGDFPVDAQKDLLAQYHSRKTIMEHKWPNSAKMVYFQAFTNTYAPLEVLKQCYEPFVHMDEIVGICIGTRPDCLSDACIDYLQQIAQQKEVWIELGLQSIHDETGERMNRCSTYKDFTDCIERLAKTKIKICVHIINGLPLETKEMMLETVQVLAKLPIHALKIHMLHILEGSLLAFDYKQAPWELLTLEDYVKIVVEQLEYLPPNIILQRLTGDGMEDHLLAPLWTKKKTIVLNEIDKEMVRQNTWQGKKATQ